MYFSPTLAIFRYMVIGQKNWKMAKNLKNIGNEAELNGFNPILDHKYVY